MEKDISIIGVPMDLGQQNKGTDMGPSAIRYAGIVPRLATLGYNVRDLGDIIIDKSSVSKESKSALRSLKKVTEVNKKLAEKISNIIKKDHFPLVLGGDHSIAIGTLAGISKFYKNLGVIWYDAHPDLNTKETSPSGNIHGMPLAVSLGIGEDSLIKIGENRAKLKPENIVLIGIRSVDEGEIQLIKELGIKVFTMHDIDRKGMQVVMSEAIMYLKDKADGVHLSLDLDGLDPQDAPGVGTPVIGGISYRESHLAMKMLAEADIITSVEVVEVNPILDDSNRTATVAVSLMEALLGERERLS